MTATEATAGHSPREEAVLASLDRRAAAIAHVRESATRATGDDQAVGWVTLAAAAERARRDHEPLLRARRLESLAPDLAAHQAVLDGHLAFARRWLDSLDDEARLAAERRRGRRIAVIGKGGAGKSMISATVARLLARQGRKVFAADLDSSHGTGFSLGVGTTFAELPPEALEEHGGSSYGWRLATGLLPHQAVERYAVTAPDGVRFLTLGKIGDPAEQRTRRSVVALRQVLGGFAEPGWDLVGDLEAGPTTPFERYHSFADQIVLVVGPAWRSALTARRLLPIVAGMPTIIVANRFRDEPDHPGLTPVVRVPFDPAVARAEEAGLAPLDEAPGSPAMAACAQLVELLTAEPTDREVMT
ncbi:MAG: hypothetical protein ACRD1K_00470 [Acidimicrobiales bacterium]